MELLARMSLTIMTGVKVFRIRRYIGNIRRKVPRRNLVRIGGVFLHE